MGSAGIACTGSACPGSDCAGAGTEAPATGHAVTGLPFLDTHFCVVQSMTCARAFLQLLSTIAVRGAAAAPSAGSNASRPTVNNVAVRVIRMVGLLGRGFGFGMQRSVRVLRSDVCKFRAPPARRPFAQMPRVVTAVMWPGAA